LGIQWQMLYKDNRYLKTQNTCKSMGLLKNLVSGIGEDKKILKAKFKDAEQDLKIQKMLEERSMSANERDLRDRLEKKRQARIKIELDQLRQEDTKELWKSSQNILKSQKNILQNGRSILKEKNIFKDTPHIFENNRSMFMK